MTAIPEFVVWAERGQMNASLRLGGAAKLYRGSEVAMLIGAVEQFVQEHEQAAYRLDLEQRNDR